MNIAEIRQQYPQYNDVSDQELVGGLHKKFYSDMPEKEFYDKVGVQPPDSLFERAKKGITNFAVSTAGNLAPLAFAAAPLLSESTKQSISDFHDQTKDFVAQNQPTKAHGFVEHAVDAASGLVPAIAAGPVGAGALLNNSITGTAVDSQDQGDSALRTIGKTTAAGATTAATLMLPVGGVVKTLAGAGGAVALSNADRLIQNSLQTDPTRKQEFDATTNVLEPIIMQLGFGGMAHFQQARGASKIIDNVATRMERGENVPQADINGAMAASQIYLRREKRQAAQGRVQAADAGLDARMGTEPVQPQGQQRVADSEQSPTLRPDVKPPVADSEPSPVFTAPPQPAVADSESFNHDALPTAAVKPADSLSVPASVKVAVVGTPAEIDALPATGRVRVDHNGASYLLDPFQAKKQFGSVRAAADMLRSGGDEAGKVLGYPPREGVADLQTAAVTKTGEVLVDPTVIKQAATAGEVAYAAEGAPSGIASAVKKVAKAMTERPETEIITPAEDTPVGVNAAGEKLYDRTDGGGRYRIRNDRADRPGGYPDHGGDLTPIEAPAPLAASVGKVAEAIKPEGGDTNGEKTNAEAQGGQGRDGLLDGPGAAPAAPKQPWEMTEKEFGQVEKDKAITYLEDQLAKAKSGEEKPNVFSNGAKSKAALVRSREADLQNTQDAPPERFASDHLGVINKAAREGQTIPEENLKRYALQPAGPKPIDLNIGFTPTAIRDATRKVSLKILSTKVGSHLAEAVDQLARWARPTDRSDAARKTGEVLTEQMGTREKHAEKFIGELNRAVTVRMKILDLLGSSSRTLADTVFNTLPEPLRQDFESRMARGEQQATPQLQQIASVIDKMFARKVEQVRALGTGALENVKASYFPGMWTKESRVAFNMALKEMGATANSDLNTWSPEQRAAVKARVDEILRNRQTTGSDAELFGLLTKAPAEGSKAFTKHKVFDDVQTARDFGLQSVSSNPMDTVLLKMGEMDRYISTHTALQELSRGGDVKLIGASDKVPDGWQKIEGPYGVKASTGEVYVAREEVAQVFNNYLSKSLYNNPYVGKVYSGYMGAANNLNMFQLGLGSAFHAGFTSGEAVISHVALGYIELARLDIPAAAKYFIESPIAPVANAMKGDRLIKALAGDGSDTSMASILDMLEMSGGRRMSQNARFFTNHTQNMLKAWADGKYAAATARSPLALTETLARPILEYLVPRHKYGVFAEMAEQWMRHNPDATHEQMRTAAQQIWNRVDSRLGQVVYDRFFMHNVAKNALQGGLRAPGWTGGTILEVGGGVKDMADMLTGGTKRAGKGIELSDRAAYVLAMATVTAVTNGAMTAMFTGEKPHGMDFIAFRDGGTDETGKPTRFVLPTYAKDVYAYTQDWSKTLIDKMHPAIGLAHDIFGKNKDYYGVQIADPEASGPMQWAQRVEYVAKAGIPFWMRGAGKTWDREGGGGVVKQMDTAGKARVAARVLAPQIGVMPATSAYTNSPLEKFINENIPRMDAAITPEESDHKKAVNALANQFMRLTRTGGDTGMVLERARQMMAAGDLTERDMKRIDEIVASPRLNRNFGKLPYTLALKAFNETATDEERKQILSAFGDKMDNWAEKRPAEFEKHKPQILQAVEHARRLMQ